MLVDDFSVKATIANHDHLPVTRVDRLAFPEWLRTNESQVQFIFHPQAHRHHGTGRATLECAQPERRTKDQNRVWNLGFPLSTPALPRRMAI